MCELINVRLFVTFNKTITYLSPAHQLSRTSIYSYSRHWSMAFSMEKMYGGILDRLAVNTDLSQFTTC